MVNYCKPSIQYLSQATACRKDFSVQEAAIHSFSGQHISFMPRGIGTLSYSTPAYSAGSQLHPSTKPFSGEWETATVKLLTCSTGNHSLRKRSSQEHLLSEKDASSITFFGIHNCPRCHYYLLPQHQRDKEKGRDKYSWKLLFFPNPHSLSNPWLTE